MGTYLLRRLLLLPITLFCIVIVNFIIINLAPGDPTTVTEISAEGRAERQEKGADVFGNDMRYLQFREHFGLTLPVVLNTWPWTSMEWMENTLETLTYKENEIPFKEYQQIRLQLGDGARFVMPKLLAVMNDSQQTLPMRITAARFFVRGGTRQAYLGPNLSEEEQRENKEISDDNTFLIQTVPVDSDTPAVVEDKIAKLSEWYRENKASLGFKPTMMEKVGILCFDTRIFRYLIRVATLDFGTLRDDTNKTVIGEVIKRFRYSLTLAIIPMLITFGLCLVIGFTMALNQHRWGDHTLNLICLVLYATPIFVVAPFLVEKVALNHTFPFTNIPIPISGFTSPDNIYESLSTWGRIWNIAQHIALPLIAVVYGSLAAQSRLARTAALEVMRQDYVRTARAKGATPFAIVSKHIGRNAAITIVTSIAGSLGILLGGSLIVETIFEINGFGKFFYEAVINRDYNVIMFSALAGSFLTLVGYLLADIAYMVLDPRVTLE